MDTFTDANQAFAASMDSQATLGVWIQPGAGIGLSAFKAKLAEVYARIAALPFVPITWADQVAALQLAHPTALVLPFPALGALGNVNAGLPSWLTDVRERAEAWEVIRKAADQARYNFAAGLNESGDPNSPLSALLANSDFWNSGWGATAIYIGETLRDAPGNMVGAIGDGALAVMGSFMRRTWYLFAIAGVVYVLWVSRAKLAKRAAGKVGI